MKKTEKIFIALVVSVIVCICIVSIKSAVQYKKISDIYSDAMELIDNVKYDEALDKLELIAGSNFKDASAMKTFCEAHIAYNNGDIAEAHLLLDILTFNHQPEYKMKKINNFKDKVEKQYSEYRAQQYKEELAKKEQEYKRKVKNGVPFVGMRESDIANTTLGSPSPKTRGNYETKNGKQYKATLYDFVKDGMVIFTARCIQGTVTEVWDSRDKPYKSYNSGGSSKAGSSNKTHNISDPYDYDDPYDFYMDNRDKFDDYNDAEDYWYDETEEYDDW